MTIAFLILLCVLNILGFYVGWKLQTYLQKRKKEDSFVVFGKLYNRVGKEKFDKYLELLDDMDEEKQI
jgi:hypothetical protein